MSVIGAGNIVRERVPEMRSGAGVGAGPAASEGGSILLGSGPRGMRIDRQPLVDVVAGLGIIGAPAVRPDARRPRETLSRAQDDADWFVVEDERKTGHALHLGKWGAMSTQLLSHLAQKSYAKRKIGCSTL
jgi:hypothetical protein